MIIVYWAPKTADDIYANSDSSAKIGQLYILGTQIRRKQKHFAGVALPYWASL